MAGQTLPIWEYNLNCINHILFEVGSYLYYTKGREPIQIFFARKAKKHLENLGSLSAEPRSGEAEIDANFSKLPVWLRILNEIRTYFRENPDAEF